MANKIWRGPVHVAQPVTVTAIADAEVLPGTVVKRTGGTFQVATDAKGDILIVNNRSYIGEDVNKAIPSGETAEAFKPVAQYEYQGRFAAGTYAQGAALSVGASGRFKAAATGDVVVATYDGAGATLAAGQLGDVKILANTYVVAA